MDRFMDKIYGWWSYEDDDVMGDNDDERWWWIFMIWYDDMMVGGDDMNLGLRMSSYIIIWIYICIYIKSSYIKSIKVNSR